MRDLRPGKRKSLGALVNVGVNKYTWIFENRVSKKSTRSTSGQFKTMKHHSKAD